MPFDHKPQEVSKLVAAYWTIADGLEDAAKTAKEYPADVVRAAMAVRDERCRARLGEISLGEAEVVLGKRAVDELERRGVRDFSVLDGLTAEELAAVPGMTLPKANAAKTLARQTSDDIRLNTRISLNADRRDHASTTLVIAISRYLYARALKNRFEPGRLKHDLAAAAELANTVAPFSSALGSLLAFGSRRRRGRDAYDTLAEFLVGESARRAVSYAEAIWGLDEISPEAAWDDFASNPIRFNKVLEELVPDLFSNGQDGPDEYLDPATVKAIDEEAFFPDGLLCTLRRYQEWGVKFALHQGRVLLGDEMGLGKTVQAVATMVSLRNVGRAHFLVCCPASLVENWVREVARHSNLRSVAAYGSSRDDATRTWARDGGVAVTTFETVGKLPIPEDLALGLLVVDEAHYIKNPQAKRSRATRAVAARAERVLFMTGTPIENDVAEMVELIGVLQPDTARKLRSFGLTPSAPRFRRAVSGVYLRRKREDVLGELPELVESEEWCTMGARETALYEAAMSKPNPFMAMRRVSWETADEATSCKARRLREIVEASRQDGRKVIVFSFFTDTLRTVSGMFGGKVLGPINGKMPPVRRQSLIDEFDRAPAGSVLVSQVQAGGTGLNIQSASVVVFCEPQLKPSIEAQSIARAYRMGQSRSVLVYRLLCKDSIDERIIEMLSEKQRVFDLYADESEAAYETVRVNSRGERELVEAEIARIRASRPAQANSRA